MFLKYILALYCSITLQRFNLQEKHLFYQIKQIEKALKMEVSGFVLHGKWRG